MLLDFEEVFYLNQIIKIPTRENNILFLVFVCMGEELNVISSYYPVQSDPNIFAVTFDKIGKHGRKENKVGEAGKWHINHHMKHKNVMKLYKHLMIC